MAKEEEKVDPFKLIPDYDFGDFVKAPECTLTYYMETNADVIALNDRVYVVQEVKDHWVNLHFLGVDSWDDRETYVRSIFKISGTGDILREGRHTHFPNDGYVFYMDYDEMITCLDYCKKFFDMN